jgi:hypothetical protein
VAKTSDKDIDDEDQRCILGEECVGLRLQAIFRPITGKFTQQLIRGFHLQLPRGT